MRIVWGVLRWTCYGALAVTVLGFVTPLLLEVTGLCSNISRDWTPQCAAPALEMIWFAGAMVTLTSVFTGLPIILAIAGAVMLAMRYGRRAAATPPERPPDPPGTT